MQEMMSQRLQEMMSTPELGDAEPVKVSLVADLDTSSYQRGMAFDQDE